MRTKLKEFVEFFIDNSEGIIYSAYALVVVIVIISVINAWHSRGVITSPYDSAYDDDSNEDVEQHEESEVRDDSYDYDEYSRFDELVETFAPKLIWGLGISVILLCLVAAPYYLISKYI